MIENLTYLKGSSTIGPPIAIFDALQREWGAVIFQPEQPVLEGELNLLQQASNTRQRNLMRAQFGPGGVFRDIYPTATGVANEIRLHTAGQPFSAVIDGLVKQVYAYDTPATATADLTQNRVTLPAYTSGTYQDLVYLEVWFEEIKSPDGAAGTDGDGLPASADTIVYHYGMDNGFTLENDLQVPTVPLDETTRRVQLRGQIRVLAGATNLANQSARGSASYSYSQPAGTTTFIAGDGTLNAGSDLDSVDGYAYAIPLVTVDRDGTAITDDDLTVVANIIYDGATLSTMIENAIADFSFHIEAESNVHGTGQGYYVARTPRADHRVEWADIANIPDLSGSSHNHDDRYARYDAAQALTTAAQQQVRTNIDAAALSHTHPWSDLLSVPIYAQRWPNFGEVTSVPWTIAGAEAGTAESVARGDHIHDSRYYTETEVDNLLSGKAASGHLHDGRYARHDAAQSLTSGQQTQIRANIGASGVGHNHDDRYYTEAESDGRYVQVAGDTMTGGLTVNAPLTLGKQSGVSRIVFPAVTSDAGKIEHDESSSNVGIMRFVVSDDASDTDIFTFGSESGGIYSEGAKITATGKGYFSSLFASGTAVSVVGHTHDDRYFTEAELSVSGAGGAVHWNNVTDKPNLSTASTTIPNQTGGTNGRILTKVNGTGNAWQDADTTQSLEKLSTLVFKNNGTYYLPGSYIAGGSLSFNGTDVGKSLYLAASGQLTLTYSDPTATENRAYIGTIVSLTSMVFNPGNPVGLF